jgi:hypothetical protein
MVDPVDAKTRLLWYTFRCGCNAGRCRARVFTRTQGGFCESRVGIAMQGRQVKRGVPTLNLIDCRRITNNRTNSPQGVAVLMSSGLYTRQGKRDGNGGVAVRVRRTQRTDSKRMLLYRSCRFSSLKGWRWRRRAQRRSCAFPVGFKYKMVDMVCFPISLGFPFLLNKVCSLLPNVLFIGRFFFFPVVWRIN